MSRKTKQITLMLITVLLAIIVGGSLYLYFWLKHSVPVRQGSLVFNGIEKEVGLTFDRMGIPQIWAESEHDGYFSLGYLHASDRIFQMDMARRVSQGRLSELLGAVTLEMDKKQRQIGHNRIAKKALSQLDEHNRLRLQAYADGVNAYRKTCRALPLEYLLLGADFQDWSVYDCLTLLSYQTWYSDALQNHDQFYRDVKEKIGAEKAGTLKYSYPDWAPVTIPEEKKLGVSISSSIAPSTFPIHIEKACPFLMGNSSNAFVVGPSKSASGRALFASDPHLPINQLPQFWYMVGLHIKESDINALGITTPGLPFVIMGHNGKAAWAFTAGGIDITQFYTEQINPDDSNQYHTPSGWRNFEYVTDTIFVSGLDTAAVIATKLSHRGPILNEHENDVMNSFRWAGFDADINLAAASGFELVNVSDFGSFRKIVTSLGALNAHWMYADINGNIGYQLGTPLPTGKKNSDRLALNGPDLDYDWEGYLPLDKTPYCLDPSQNWLATSNNLPTRSLDFPKLSGSFAADRILRITELLNGNNEFSIADCKKFQFDRTDNYLLRWRWTIAKHLVESGHHELADLMNNWNGSTGLDSKETALAMVFLTQLKQLTFEDELGNMYKGVRTIWLDEAFHNEADSFWFDDINTDSVESKDDIAHLAVDRAVEIVGQKTWGDFNSLTMRHPMGGVPILGRLLRLNKHLWTWPGTTGTLNASFLVANDSGHFETIVGPSWRFVIDFADVDKAEFVLPAGNSGNPMSPHFFDFNQMWQEGKYWNIPISEELVKSKAVSTLTLKPAAVTKKD